jgi:hypothetical protein
LSFSIIWIIELDPYLFAIGIQTIKIDAGSQFTSSEFREAFISSHVGLSLSALTHQEQNHISEKTRQSLHTLGRTMLVFSRIPNKCGYHALLYAIDGFPVLPIKDLRNSMNEMHTPFELFYGKIPNLGSFRVCGCPVVAKKYTIITRKDGKLTKHTTIHHGILGLFIWFPQNQQGWIIYLPSSRRTAVSYDVDFDEHFDSALSYTWKPSSD